MFQSFRSVLGDSSHRQHSRRSRLFLELLESRLVPALVSPSQSVVMDYGSIANTGGLGNSSPFATGTPSGGGSHSGNGEILTYEEIVSPGPVNITVGGDIDIELPPPGTTYVLTGNPVDIATSGNLTLLVSAITGHNITITGHNITIGSGVRLSAIGAINITAGGNITWGGGSTTIGSGSGEPGGTIGIGSTGSGGSVGGVSGVVGGTVGGAGGSGFIGSNSVSTGILSGGDSYSIGSNLVLALSLPSSEHAAALDNLFSNGWSHTLGGPAEGPMVFIGQGNGGGGPRS